MLDLQQVLSFIFEFLLLELEVHQVLLRDDPLSTMLITCLKFYHLPFEHLQLLLYRDPLCNKGRELFSCLLFDIFEVVDLDLCLFSTKS